jgi:hypothetical protein
MPDVEQRVLVETLIAQTVGSIITDVFDTNVSASRDGNKSQDNTQVAVGNAGAVVTSRIGVDLGAGASFYISGMKTWGATNRGYGSFGFTGTIDLVCKASTIDPATNSWVGTTISTVAQFSNSAAVNAKEALGGNTHGIGFRYVWVEITGGSAIFPFMAEMEFYARI